MPIASKDPVGKMSEGCFFAIVLSATGLGQENARWGGSIAAS